MRHIFIGDIHGCYTELVDLLAKIDVQDADRVMALGDMTRKGPAADRCIDLWRERGYESVLGNNDVKVIEHSERWMSRVFASSADRDVIWRRERVDFLRHLPLYSDVPEVSVVAVHGGVLPKAMQFTGDLVTREAALELRYIRKTSSGWAFVPKGKQSPDDPFWADVWDGDRMIVYGHTPREEPLVHRRALGIDTGCVYGGKLTAAVFAEPDRWQLVSIPARRRYSR